MLGEGTYAVDVRDAREVVTLDGFTPVPGAPASVMGVFNLRGTVLPLVEARPLLGRAATIPVPGTPAVVLAARSWRAAVAIDRVVGLEWFDDATLAAGGGPFAAGTFAQGDSGAITLLDADGLLSALREAWTSPPFATPEV
ncbi:MAG TPA: chemotaxis protein CheW [Candidatus Limnocylindria bacterium]|nr:chemotaxis protein CheW [Candidatus Limnocylindria bacterium]